MRQPVNPVEHNAEESREPKPRRQQHSLPSFRSLHRPHPNQSIRRTYAEVYEHLFGRYKAFNRIRDANRQVQSDPLLALLSISSTSSSSSTVAVPPSPPPLCRRAPLPDNVHRRSKESDYDSIGTLESGSVEITPYNDEAPTVLYEYDDRVQIGFVPVKIYDTDDNGNDSSDPQCKNPESYDTPDGTVSCKEYLDQIVPLIETDDYNSDNDSSDEEQRYPITGYVDTKIYDDNNDNSDNDSECIALGITDSIEYIDQISNVERD